MYGRGAVDMKGGIACASRPRSTSRGNGGQPKGSISFLITGDEEGLAVNGTVKLLQWAAARGENIRPLHRRRADQSRTLGDMIKIGRRGSLPARSSSTACRAMSPIRIAPTIRCADIVALIAALDREPLDRGNAHFEPSNLEFTSVDVGNPAANVIPAKARARFNIRFNDQPHARPRWSADRRAPQGCGNDPLRASTGSRRTPTCS